MNRVDVIQSLLKKIKGNTYLEIGVLRGDTFRKIKAPVKYGVDINQPDEETKSLIKNNVKFFQMTSDEFFEKQAPLLNRFDVVFIDGLHEYEQVKKDVFNSLKYLSPKGVIVLHDCNPQTEIMQIVPQKQGEWCGDVWKAIPFFRAILNKYIFVIDTDYGLGIIAPPKEFIIEKLKYKELNYFDLEKNREYLLNLKSEEYFLKLLNYEN